MALGWRERDSRHRASQPQPASQAGRRQDRLSLCVYSCSASTGLIKLRPMATAASPECGCLRDFPLLCYFATGVNTPPTFAKWRDAGGSLCDATLRSVLAQLSTTLATALQDVPRYCTRPVHMCAAAACRELSVRKGVLNRLLGTLLRLYYSCV